MDDLRFGECNECKVSRVEALICCAALCSTFVRWQCDVSVSGPHCCPSGRTEERAGSTCPSRAAFCRHGPYFIMAFMKYIWIIALNALWFAVVVHYWNFCVKFNQLGSCALCHSRLQLVTKLWTIFVALLNAIFDYKCNLQYSRFFFFVHFDRSPSLCFCFNCIKNAPALRHKINSNNHDNDNASEIKSTRTIEGGKSFNRSEKGLVFKDFKYVVWIYQFLNPL